MRRRLWLGALPFAGLLVASSCLTATQITVHVTTNASCDGAQPADVFRELAIAAGSPSHVAANAPAATGSSCKALEASLGSGFGPNDLGTLVVVPQGDKEMGIEIDVIASVRAVQGETVDLDTCETWAVEGKSPAGFRDPNDPATASLPRVPCMLARRRLGFVPHFKLELPVQLDTNCTGVFCAPGSTCVDSTCVPDDASCDTNGDGSCSLGSGGGGGAPASSSSGMVTTGGGAGSTSGVSSSDAVSASGVTVSSATAVASSSSTGGCACTGCPDVGELCDPNANCACACDDGQCNVDCMVNGMSGGTCNGGACSCVGCSGVCPANCGNGLTCDTNSCVCVCDPNACNLYCQGIGHPGGTCAIATNPLPPIAGGVMGSCNCL